MKILRLVLPACFLLLILLFSGCDGERTTSTETSRDIVVTLRNLEEERAVHMFFEGYKAGSENLVNPESSIQVTITAHRIGHKFSFYVTDAADPGGKALLTTNVEVTATSFNSGTAELHWTGTDLLRIGW